jgi:hypothetical protein
VIRFRAKPYIVWALDQWKILLLFALFCFLVAGALIWP